MSELPRKKRLARVGGVFIAGVLCAVAFSYFRPFDLYLLNSWESELSTLADEDVEVRLEQIAALGERSLPTLVAALHSERQVVAATAGAVLRRELGKLELRSSDESSPIVAGFARELAERSNRPGPYSVPASTQLATRLLLWPINRELIDSERLVADCELIIRSAKGSLRIPLPEQSKEDLHPQDGLAASRNEPRTAELLTPVAVSNLPAQLMDAPPLPPQQARVLSEAPASTTTQPPRFIAVQAPRALDATSSLAADEATDTQQHKELRQKAGAAPSNATARPDLRALSDLDLMQELAGDDQSLVREAVDELYRRGFQTKHFRLAESLVDPNPNVRLEFVRSLPQMSGIDSRPWLLWLSRDQDPAVRKAAIAVIATSSDAALQQRVRELEREETDDEVLRVVRQILNSGPTNAIR